MYRQTCWNVHRSCLIATINQSIKLLLQAAKPTNTHTHTHTHTHTPTTNYTFPLPFSVAVITYINFVLPCFLPSYFSLPIFPVALFSGCRFCRCRFFSCPVYQLPFYRCRFTFYPVCVCWRTHRRALQKRMNRSRCCLDSTQPCIKWGVHISTAWRIRLNDTCSATMRRGWEYR